jgi:hypothetical protein
MLLRIRTRYLLHVYACLLDDLFYTIKRHYYLACVFEFALTTFRCAK